jgi:hypothetical protein
MRPSNPFLKVTLGVVLTAGSAPAALAKGVAPRFDLTNPAGASLQSPSKPRSRLQPSWPPTAS